MKKVKVTVQETLEYETEVVVSIPDNAWVPDKLMLRVAEGNTDRLVGFTSYLTAMGCKVAATENSGMGSPTSRDLEITEYEYLSVKEDKN